MYYMREHVTCTYRVSQEFRLLMFVVCKLIYGAVNCKVFK